MLYFVCVVSDAFSHIFPCESLYVFVASVVYEPSLSTALMVYVPALVTTLSPGYRPLGALPLIACTVIGSRCASLFFVSFHASASALSLSAALSVLGTNDFETGLTSSTGLLSLPNDSLPYLSSFSNVCLDVSGFFNPVKTDLSCFSFALPKPSNILLAVFSTVGTFFAILLAIPTKSSFALSFTALALCALMVFCTVLSICLD